MKRSRTRSISGSVSLSVSILVALLLLPAVLTGQDDRDPLLARQRELRELKGEMEKNRAEIERLSTKEKTLGDLDVRIRRDREMTVRYIAELEQQERALLRDLVERQEQLDCLAGAPDCAI